MDFVLAWSVGVLFLLAVVLLVVSLSLRRSRKSRK